MKQLNTLSPSISQYIGLPLDGDIGFGKRMTRAGTGGKHGATEGKEQHFGGVHASVSFLIGGRFQAV